MSSLAFTLSVDDGHPLDLRIAEILARHRLRASFYLPIRNAEGAPVMTAAQARELSRYAEIGSHTLDHCYLTRVDDNEAWRQISEGKTELEQRLGHAYPASAIRVGNSMLGMCTWSGAQVLPMLEQSKICTRTQASSVLRYRPRCSSIHTSAMY